MFPVFPVSRCAQCPSDPSVTVFSGPSDQVLQCSQFYCVPCFPVFPVSHCYSVPSATVVQVLQCSQYYSIPSVAVFLVFPAKILIWFIPNNIKIYLQGCVVPKGPRIPHTANLKSPEQECIIALL